MKIFAITNKATLVCEYIGLHSDEHSAWQIFLGWPGPEEIRDAQLRSICQEVHCYPVKQMVWTEPRDNR